MALKRATTTMHHGDWSLVNAQYSSTLILLFLTKAISVRFVSLFFHVDVFLRHSTCSCGPQLTTLIFHPHAKSSMEKEVMWLQKNVALAVNLMFLMECSTRLPFALNVLFLCRANLLWFGPDLFFLQELFVKSGNAPAQCQFKPSHVLLFAKVESVHLLILLTTEVAASLLC